MATVSTTITGAGVTTAVKRLQNYKTFNPGVPHGHYLLSWSKTLTAAEKADFDASGDFLELFTLPANVRLEKASVVVPDMDSNGAPAITIDLMAGSTVLVNNDTAGQAGGTINYDAAGVVDVSSTTLKLKIETVAATVPGSYASGFSAEALVYFGAPVSVTG
jgi:hypothetical protein